MPELQAELQSSGHEHLLSREIAQGPQDTREGKVRVYKEEDFLTAAQGQSTTKFDLEITFTRECFWVLVFRFRCEHPTTILLDYHHLILFFLAIQAACADLRKLERMKPCPCIDKCHSAY